MHKLELLSENLQNTSTFEISYVQKQISCVKQMKHSLEFTNQKHGIL